MFNVPNTLTILRLLAIPAFVWAYFNDHRVAALIIFVAASLTDLLDGYLARKLNQITDFGKLADPLADKLMLIALLFCLAFTGYAPWPMLAVIALKELYMMIGGLLMLKRRVVVYSNLLGKVATATFMVALALVFPWHEVNILSAIGLVLLYAAVALSVLSAVFYTRWALKSLRIP